MSTTVFYIALAAGGALVGALCTLLLPSKRTGGLFAAMWAGAFGSIFVGLLITELFGAAHEVGLAAIAAGPLFAFSPLGDLFDGGTDGSGWGDGDGGGDGGGGDGGGGD
ncbi:MAG: hypothetical protein QOI73_1740 [Solirubrobacteraceae bacterium]|nr:hypothetical protein [Solirubrobacteraceae bacterium]